MINEQKIRLFLSLAETLNFTETANQLFITQQAVSKHISQLETDLGFPLFIRSTHSVRLTPAGERCKIFFREKLEEITGFIADEQEEQRRRSKSLRIGYNNWLDYGNPVMTARVRFNQMYPDISHVPETQAPDFLQTKLRDGDLDLIIVIRRFLQNEAGLIIRELTKLRMSVLVSSEIAASGEEMSVSNLSRYPLWINSFSEESVAETRARAKREMRILGLTNKDILIAPNRDSVYIAIQTGEGVAISCMSNKAPEGISSIPTNAYDSLVCVCMETNRRKLVQVYMNYLEEAFSE